MESKISVVMPCWIVSDELLSLTKASVESLGGCELIIVDNASTQGGGWLRSIADLYVRNKENKGYAVAVNQGLRLASNPLIAIANNDIVASPNWQDVAREVLADEKVYSCHFRMFNYNSQGEYGGNVFLTGRERWCTSSFFVINTRRCKFYYDENYLNSYDDWDYWLTVRRAGFRTAYTDKAFYRHLHSSSQKYNTRREEDDKENKEYFKQKWGMYAEDIFARDYPDQLKISYDKGFGL